MAFEELPLVRWGSLEVTRLRLSRQGGAVAFHVEPDTGSFGPGSTLYFVSGGERLNPHGREAVYELGLSRSGVRMGVGEASPVEPPLASYRKNETFEENRNYQGALLEANDLWQWETLFSPVSRSFGFTVTDLLETEEPSRLRVWLEGASDPEGTPDHHVRVGVNGVMVAETSWDGLRPRLVEVELEAGLLREGENRLLENARSTSRG